MTGVRELMQVRVVSAAPEHVRLSVLGERTQLDISLPLDVTVADAIPELVRLVQTRGNPNARADGSSKDAQRVYWVLARLDSDEPLDSDVTLREAGLTNGALLRLFDERALTPPTLYDDVVDAAARLNKASFAAWDGAAAKGMAFVGVQMAALALLYFLCSPLFKPHRVALAGISIVVALTLVGVAALAHRSYGQSAVGAALGWAAIPISAGVVWALTSEAGGFVLAAGCAVMVVEMVLLYRAVGTGHWGYLSSGVFFGLCGVALVARQLGVRADIVGVALTLLSTFACLIVPRMTATLAYTKRPKGQVQAEHEEPLFENPFEPKPVVPAGGDDEADDADSDSTPTAEGVWNRVRSATLTRSALYAGLAAAAAVGGAAVLRSQSAVQWSTLVFALSGAATLGLFARHPGTAVERAALAAPALALLAFTGVTAQSAHQPIPQVTLGVLLILTVAFAVVGLVQPSGSAADVEPGRKATVLAYLEYGVSVALFPLALWVVGVYGRLGL
ncbi:type VII secretion integral membrane protein EccD [Mycolicibacterium fortuitum]|uniref:type VII secretion integral membrane protein EccD n=1 Tax=Mycolicibacterium fortuitum TaxID=1766 RepID=UPI001CDBA184|nr:type VII secretion integral membrane protein EccD [Mycolicibacterium fortuitum]UBV23948.1 type VII secretion integral membrane protein EccD [Mycolicibacterium fortuitum]